MSLQWNKLPFIDLWLWHISCVITRVSMGLLPNTLTCGLRLRLECRACFFHHRLKRKPIVCDPGMHHGTCAWHISGSLTRGHYGVGSWSLYTKQATPGSPPLLCRGHPTQSATSTMEPQGFQWALIQWRRSPVKVTRSPWDYFLKTQNGWQPTCVDMQNNVENVFVECTIYFLTIMQLTEAGLSIWQVQ